MSKVQPFLQLPSLISQLHLITWKQFINNSFVQLCNVGVHLEEMLQYATYIVFLEGCAQYT